MPYEHRRQDRPFFVQSTAAYIRVNKASVHSASRPGYPNFIVKFVEAHGCGRRPQASRHLTFQPDAAPSHGKCRADEPHIHIKGRNSGRVVVRNNVSDRGTAIFQASVHCTGRGAKADTCGGSGVAIRHGISRIMVCNCRLILPRCLRHGEVQPTTVFRGRQTVARRRIEYGSSGMCAVDA